MSDHTRRVTILNAIDTHNRRALTQKATLAAIRALGLTASYNPEYREYRIDYRRHDPRHRAHTHVGIRVSLTSYYTNDRSDALATAQQMANWTPPGTIRHP